MGHGQHLRPVLERDVPGATCALWTGSCCSLIREIQGLLCLQKLVKGKV